MDALEESLKEWLDKRLPEFLVNINSELIEDVKWTLPAIEDFILVVAVKDYADGLGGVFSVTSPSPSYRIKGLLQEAMDF
jgi:hypothetical protein